VTLLEKKLHETKPAYRRYAEETKRLLPVVSSTPCEEGTGR